MDAAAVSQQLVCSTEQSAGNSSDTDGGEVGGWRRLPRLGHVTCRGKGEGKGGRRWATFAYKKAVVIAQALVELHLGHLPQPRLRCLVHLLHKEAVAISKHQLARAVRCGELPEAASLSPL